MNRQLSEKCKHSILLSLLEIIEKVRNNSDSAELKASMSSTQYLREHASISFGLPRRMGNTTLAVELLSLFDDAVLIVPSTGHAQAVLSNVGTSYDGRVFSNDQVCGGSLIATNCKLVIVDCATHAPEKVWDNVYLSNPAAIVRIA